MKEKIVQTKKHKNMKKVILLIILLSYLWTFGQTPANDPHWQLVWEDNFNALNTNIWLVQDNFDHYGEKQVFINENVYTENGSLVCEIKNESYSCPSWAIEPNWHCVRQYNTGQPYSYTSGWIESKAAYNTQYGYIEARINFPYQYALWPAFWTLIGDGVTNGTNAAEIDIAEMLGETGPNIITTNIHKVFPDNNIYREDISPLNYSWGYGNWHKYAIEWSPSKIIWYVDDSPIRVFQNHGIIDPVKIILGIGLRPDNQLNTTSFPQKMYVDYVRVYNLKNDCKITLNLCNYNFGTHDNKVKQNIIIGNGSCTNALNIGENVYLRASEGVLINGDFTVPVGAEIYIDVNSCY